MKPKLLRMAGIGSFPQEVTIDFGHLDAMGLYLVVGPTGAGKTTIFEAMCYALFAKVPSGRDIESTFPHERSFIDFTFSHNGADHRVVRDNTRTTGDYYEQLPKGARVAQRRSVTQHVEDLLNRTVAVDCSLHQLECVWEARSDTLHRADLNLLVGQFDPYVELLRSNKLTTGK